MSNWILLENSQDGIDYIYPLFTFVLKQFVEIFGEEVMGARLCGVFNDADALCPRFIMNPEPQSLYIRVRTTSFGYWSKIIYQLSHELTHYVIYILRRKEKLDRDIEWFEETVCEAMSFYILGQSSARWSECTLSERNLGYASALKEYLDDIINEETADKSTLKSCRTLAELQEIERTCQDQDRRIDRRIERNYLYDIPHVFYKYKNRTDNARSQTTSRYCWSS